MKKIVQIFDQVVEWLETMLSTWSLVCITILVIAQVILRYCFNVSITWGEEVIITLIMTMAMFGAARGVRTHAHVDVAGVANVLPKWAAYILRALTTLIAILLLVATVYGSFYLASRTKGVTAMLRYPQKWNYMIIGAGSAFTAYEFIKIAWKRIKGEY